MTAITSCDGCRYCGTVTPCELGNVEQYQVIIHRPIPNESTVFATVNRFADAYRLMEWLTTSGINFYNVEIRCCKP